MPVAMCKDSAFVHFYDFAENLITLALAKLWDVLNLK